MAEMTDKKRRYTLFRIISLRTKIDNLKRQLTLAEERSERKKARKLRDEIWFYCRNLAMYKGWNK